MTTFLPIELINIIYEFGHWKQFYNLCMIELKSIVDFDKAYIINKPSPYIDCNDIYFIKSVDCTRNNCYRFALRTAEQFFLGDRGFLCFYFHELALNMKFHPTQKYQHGGKMELCPVHLNGSYK